MQTFVAVVLFLTAVFNVVTWPTFYRRVARDPRARDAAGAPTKFLTVHRVIVGIALAIALVSLVGGVLLVVVGL